MPSNDPRINVAFLILPTVQLLDFSGPAQVFHEAIALDAPYRLRFCGLESNPRSSQGLRFASLEDVRTIDLRRGDRLIIPGVSGSKLGHEDMRALGEPLFRRLRALHENGVQLCTICNATFVLAHAGLLNGRRCTTHWKRLEQLQREFPDAVVLPNRLFVRDGTIDSSAGISSGIDLALAMIEEEQGPILAAKVAKELVVYLRRSGDDPQISVYLDYRNHLNPRIHAVQDAIASDPARTLSLASLGRVANMSARNLTRVFRRETAVTIKEYTTLIRMERAARLMNSPELTLDAIAKDCGFRDARQFRRVWRAMHGAAPSDSRAGSPARRAHAGSV